jgi:uncharacterized protein YerC
MNTKNNIQAIANRFKGKKVSIITQQDNYVIIDSETGASSQTPRFHKDGRPAVTMNTLMENFDI